MFLEGEYQWGIDFWNEWRLEWKKNQKDKKKCKVQKDEACGKRTCGRNQWLFFLFW